MASALLADVLVGPEPKTTRVISVASGKGGTGKTSVAVNLATTLSSAGRRVCLLDADLGLSNVEILLGIRPEQTLEDVIFGGLPMEKAAVRVAQGFDIISGSSGVARMAELTREERARLTTEFSKLSAYDYLLIDNSPGISAQVASVCLASEEIVVVVNPEATSVADAYALIKVLRENGLWKNPLVVVNRARSQTLARAVFDRLSQTTRRYLGISCHFLAAIPDDPAMARAAALRQPVVQAEPRSPASTAIQLAAREFSIYVSRRPPNVESPQEFFERSVMHIQQGPRLSQTADPGADRALLARDLGLVEAMLTRLRREGTGQELLPEVDKIRKAVRILRRRHAGKCPAPAEPVRPAEGRRRILVLCPDPNLLEVLVELAMEAGFQILGAVNGARVATRLLPEADVLLASSGGPGLSDEALERLIAEVGTRPAIFVEGFEGRSEFAVRNRQRLAAVVQRPFRVSALTGVLRRFAQA